MYKYSYIQKYYIYLIPNNLTKFIKVNNHKIRSFSMFLPKNRPFSLEIHKSINLPINKIR